MTPSIYAMPSSTCIFLKTLHQNILCTSVGRFKSPESGFNSECAVIYIYIFFLNRPSSASCSCVAQNKPHFLSLVEGERVERVDGRMEGWRDEGTRERNRAGMVSLPWAARGVCYISPLERGVCPCTSVVSGFFFSGLTFIGITLFQIRATKLRRRVFYNTTKCISSMTNDHIHKLL